jgi:hypothetical protein
LHHHFGQFGASPLELPSQDSKTHGEGEGEMSSEKKQLDADIEKQLSEVPPDLAKCFRNIFKSAIDNPHAEQTLSTASKTAEIIQLPLWPEATTGTPDCFLRSALFAATDRGRTYVDQEKIKSVGCYDIKFTGMQLTQLHLVVWEALVRLARKHPLGDECVFTGHSFLREELGYKGKIGKTDYEQLSLIVRQLTASVLEVGVKENLVYGAGLVDWYARDDDSRLFKIKLNRGLIALYGRGQWTQLQWTQRLALKKHPLALWLHGFYSTHAAPFPVSVEFIREKSGSGIKELYRFRQALKKALGKIKAEGAIVDWCIDKKTDLVHVQKTPTPAQTKHLTKPSK